jgi:alpha-1,6-mannosyltransferase
MPARPGVTTVHITNAYHPTSGGIRTFYRALLAEGNRVGRRVVLIVPGERNEHEDIGACGRIYYIKARPAPAFDRRYRLILPHRYAPLVGRAVVSVLEAEQPALVEICDKYSLPYLAAMLRKRWYRRVPRPRLVGLSCERFDDNMSAYLSSTEAARRFTRWYIRHIYGPPFDVHVANSAYTAAELREALWDRSPGFIRVVPAGVDVGAFNPVRRSIAERWKLLASTRGTSTSALLFYAGRLSPEKNIPLLVDTLRALVRNGGRDCRMVVAGDGPCADWLREQAVGELKDRIVLCGSLDRDTLATYCASCDLFVHPNPREPFGIGPLEAMASGVPVVVPNSGGVLEYANDCNAWLADPTGEAFATAIQCALRDGAGRVTAARDTAARFSLRHAAQNCFALYDELFAPPVTSQSRHRHQPVTADC